MSPADLLPTPDGLAVAVADVAVTADRIVVAATCSAPTSDCPACGRPSDRVHSRYLRTLADLPAGGRRFVLRLTARRFVCRNSGCDQAVFCERLPGLAAAHARVTGRLADLHRAIGYAVGGEPGSRLAGELAAPVSGDTILRRVTAASGEAEPAYRFVGIDDFALRRGHTYGTILIDLERGRVIDILDGRDGVAVAAWLKAHPGVEVVTRDRWAAYANAAAAGAPRATQVADRFHLVANLRELVEKVFDAHAAALDHVLRPPATPSVVPAAPPPSTEGERAAGAEPPATPPRRDARFAAVKQLRAGGMGVRSIARELGLSVATVRRYLRSGGRHDARQG